MRRLSLPTAALLLGLFCTAPLPLAAQDVADAKDHPLIPRYEGATIRGYAASAFDDYRLITGKVDTPQLRPENSKELEGATSHIFYRTPEGRAPLEVFRNYEGALVQAGFETVFTCAKVDCGRLMNAVLNPGARYNGLIYGDDQRYLAARLARPEGDVWVSLYVTGFPPENRTYVLLETVDMKPMEEKMVVLEASAMEEALARDGKVAIYGILFDFDSATITPESSAQVEQLAALLATATQMRVIIVGHTDGQGAFDYNLSLSQRRAQSVVDALSRDHGVASERMMPAGAGMVSPVASNRTEDGRSKNRRVEVVEIVGR